MGPEADDHGRIGFEDSALVYEAAGQGPPLLLIHGLSGSSRWWSKNVGDLAKRFRVYTVDLQGFGRSRARGRFNLHLAAKHLVALLDRLGIERASVVGHSMGGLIAVDLAATFPERVDRLILVDAAVFPTRRDRSLTRRTWGFVRSLRLLPADLAPVLAGDALRAGPGSLGLATYQLLRTDWTSKLSQVQAPTLVICGESDTIVPVDSGRDLAGKIASARLVILPGCGHNPMWDRPQEFNREVISFLLSTSPR
jgi:pimeloyl-ACP methyl ester carboxylesterase